MSSHHGRGRTARRSAARQLARSHHMPIGLGPDSSAIEHYPAPRWTHELRADLEHANARAQERTSSWSYLPPPHEPVAEAWGRLERERRAERLHRLAADRAQAAADAARRAAIDRARDKLGLNQPWAPVPLSASAGVRAAVAKAVAGCALPAVPPGASLPLGAGNRTRLDRLRDRREFPGLGEMPHGDGRAPLRAPAQTMAPQPVSRHNSTHAAEEG